MFATDKYGIYAKMLLMQICTRCASLKVQNVKILSHKPSPKKKRKDRERGQVFINKEVYCPVRQVAVIQTDLVGILMILRSSNHGHSSVTGDKATLQDLFLQNGVFQFTCIKIVINAKLHQNLKHHKMLI